MKKSPNKTKRMDRLVLYIIIAVLVTVIGFCSWWFLMGGMYVSEQGKMENYLKDKYGEEFSVSNIHTEGSGLGVRGEIVGEARLRKDPSLKFEITNMSDGLHDQYPAAVWMREERKSIVKEIQNGDNSVKIDIDIKILSSVDRNIKSPIPNLKDLATSNSEGITYYIHIQESKQFDESKKLSYMDRLKLASTYLGDLSSVGNKYISYSVPYSQEYQYGLNIDADKIMHVVAESKTITFDNSFKKVRIK